MKTITVESVIGERLHGCPEIPHGDFIIISDTCNGSVNAVIPLHIVSLGRKNRDDILRKHVFDQLPHI